MNFEIDKHNDYISNHYADGVNMYSNRSCFIRGMPSEVGYVENIRRCLTDINNSHIALGYALIALLDSHVYARQLSAIRYDLTPSLFYDYCFNRFGLDKSQVSRHVNVVASFGDGRGGLRECYADRSFSYLCELLSVRSMAPEISATCKTVADVREYKAKLKEQSVVATSQQISLFDNDRTKTESEKPVATSQQSKCNDEHEFFRLSPVKIPLSGGNYDYTRYDRFRGLSLRELLLQYIALEKKYNELREMFNIKNDIGVTV